MPKPRETYGMKFDPLWSQAQIERFMLQQGGYYIKPDGTKLGNGLMHHYSAFWSELWPQHEQNRWTRLIMEALISHKYVGIIGPGNSWKSSTCARMALMDWILFPNCTLCILSSTTLNDLKNRIYGEISKFWQLAKDSHPWLPGYPLDYLCVIAAEAIDREDTAKVRDLRNGIQGIPTKSADGKVQGVSRFVGKKNTRVWAIFDEAQFAERSFLESQANLSGNGPSLVPGYKRDDNGQILLDAKGNKMVIEGYRAVFVGNPNNSRPDNCLHLVCEPECGWANIPDDGKTKTWTAKRVPGSVVQCHVIALDGRDSPNNDFPGDKPRWRNLVSAQRLAEFAIGSEDYYSQGVGVVKLGIAGYKIITRELCEQFNCFDQVTWDGAYPRTRIGALDAAYGGVGGDRCVLNLSEFGRCTDGVVRIFLHPPIIVPVKINPNISPEDQIAMFCKEKMEALQVDPNNFFFDGRGTLAVSFARIWSPRIVAVEFGGKPTERVIPEFIEDKDTKERRPKKASEAFVKFVDELWFNWKFVCQSDQLRGITLESVLDASPREWKEANNHKKTIETKADLKKRTGCSPDLADTIAIGIEGALRRGFKIAKLAAPHPKSSTKKDALLSHLEKLQELHESQELQVLG